ncbi:MAG: lytic transglycosylase domain-containing protein [Clostridia bacterium]|nr:lytic transglycosylase domain-containing protein [Clostridia bacterium]
MSKRKRSKKAKSRVAAFLTTCLLLVGVVGVGFALRAGYRTYTASTYRLQYYDEVMTYAAKYDVQPSLIYGIIRTESNFDPNAHSSADAKGLMQITADTLEWLQYRSDEFSGLTEEHLFEPDTNIHCGVYALSLLKEMFPDEDTVIAAYNAGLGNVQEWLQDPAYSDDGVTLHTIPYEETRKYVQRVRTAQAIYRDFYRVDDAT